MKYIMQGTVEKEEDQSSTLCTNNLKKLTEMTSVEIHRTSKTEASDEDS